jgi:serine/threonine protein kinase
VHPTATLAPGNRLGAYEIVAFLGAGGMGEVYRARDARLERDVALKVLPAQVTNDTVRRQWLTREAGVTVEVETRVTGTVLIPWHGVEGLPSAFASSSNDLSRLPRARSIPVSGVAPGRTAARYAFSRENQQANLYRIRLP